MRTRFFPLLIPLLVASATVAGAQLPPLSWTCPMHPDVVDDRPGTCPICRMTLEPVRLDTVWSCPVHEVITSAAPGQCRICGRQLVHVTVAVSWVCRDRPDVVRLEPATCRDGSSAPATYRRRPHGNHNPQHGGEFFMAPDQWHHVEGVYATPGVFRIHVYDDYSKPLSAAQIQRVRGTVTTPNGDFPFAARRGRDFLEARVGAAAPPVAITATVAFTPGAPAYRFDFTFPEYSREPVRLKADATHGTTKPDVVSGFSRTRDALDHLHERARELAAIIDRGAFGELYVPAFAAKDLALAIEGDAAGEGPQRRAAIEAAASRLVRAAWMLDAAGDVGNRDSIGDAYAHFAAAVTEIEAAVAPPHR